MIPRTLATAALTVALALAAVLMTPGTHVSLHRHAPVTGHRSAARMVCAQGAGPGSCGYLLASGAAAP